MTAFRSRNWPEKLFSYNGLRILLCLLFTLFLCLIFYTLLKPLNENVEIYTEKTPAVNNNKSWKQLSSTSNLPLENETDDFINEISDEQVKEKTNSDENSSHSHEDLSESESGGNRRQACEIPNLIANSKTIRDLDHKTFTENDYEPACLTESRLKFKMDFNSHLIRVNPSSDFWKLTKCCYQSFRIPQNRHEDFDTEFSSTCHKIEKNITKIPPEHEYLRIKCKEPKSKRLVFEDFFPHFHDQNPRKFAFRTREKGNEEKIKAPKLSIMIFGIDSASHASFQRWMPLSHNFLTKSLDALEFHGFNSFGAGTLESVYPMISGVHFEEIRKLARRYESDVSKLPFIFKDMVEAGYVTGYQGDLISLMSSGFHLHPVDYDLRPLTMMMSDRLRGHGFTESEYADCFGQRLAFKSVLDNFVRLAHAMKNRKYFHLTWTETITHAMNEMAKFGDQILVDGLQKLVDLNLMNQTAYIFLSDHGARYGEMRETTEQGYLEERLPLFYLVLPPWFKTTYKKAMQNLKLNTKRLMTTLDIYKTIRDLMNLTSIHDSEIEKRSIYGLVSKSEKRMKKQDYSQSLFLPIPSTRNCDATRISPLFCICLQRKEIENAPNDKNIRESTNFIIGEMNKKLANFSMCAPLELGEIVSAQSLGTEDTAKIRALEISRFGNLSEAAGKSVKLDEHFKIKFTTNPGGALWEAICTRQQSEQRQQRKNSKNKNPTPVIFHMGKIERINAYRKVKKCVPNKSLREFCQCQD